MLSSSDTMSTWLCSGVTAKDGTKPSHTSAWYTELSAARSVTYSTPSSPLVNTTSRPAGTCPSFMARRVVTSCMAPLPFTFTAISFIVSMVGDKLKVSE